MAMKLSRTRFFASHGPETIATGSDDKKDASFSTDVNILFRDAHTSHTQRAYQKDWQNFCSWCAEQHRRALPCTPETLAMYLHHLAKRFKVASIERALAAIARVHRGMGHESPRRAPRVQSEMRSIKQALGCVPRGKHALLVDGIARLVDTCDAGTLRGLRNRAILVLGFAGAFRRSELVALNIEDLSDDAYGLRVQTSRGESCEAGQGQEKGIPFGDHQATCPVLAVRAWLNAAELSAGPVFVGVNRHGCLTRTRLHPCEIARVVQGAARAAGLDPDKFAGHSLRSGLMTAAAIAGKPTDAILRQTGHASPSMLLRYLKRAKLFDNNAADGIGL